MKVIIDRFEGEYAVVELPDGAYVKVPSKLFPDAKESDIVDIEVDRDETEKRKRKTLGLIDELFNDR